MVAIITGASRGIGYETAKYLAFAKKMEIYAFSRDRHGLQQLVSECGENRNGSRIFPVAVDLLRLADEPDLLLNTLGGDVTHIDILINNAGYLVNRPFTTTSLAEVKRMFDVNFFIPALIIRELMPLIGHKGLTHVVNIGSMAGFQGSLKYPGLSFYSASKAALACLTECLQQEIRDREVVFNCLALGSAQTAMFGEAFPGKKASMSAQQIACFIGDFALNGHRTISGKVIPVSHSSP